MTTSGLTDLERQILDFEAGRWRFQGAKDSAVRETFGWSRVRYDQALLALLDNPAAYVAAPMLVKRLRRLRELRRQQRAG